MYNDDFGTVTVLMIFGILIWAVIQEGVLPWWQGRHVTRKAKHGQ